MPGAPERDNQRDRQRDKNTPKSPYRGAPQKAPADNLGFGAPTGGKAHPLDDRTTSFGYWLRRRRKALDLTQEQLAQSVACSRFAIRKIEADERRPSRRLAERLAEKLAIPPQERDAFLETARALRPRRPRWIVDKAPARAGPRRSRRSEPVRRPRQRDATCSIGLLAHLGAGIGSRGADRRRARHRQEPAHARARAPRRARAACATLATNCYEIERAMPYQPVIDLVTQALELAAEPRRCRSCRRCRSRRSRRSCPAVAERVAVPCLSADFPEARQARLFRAIVQLFEALAAGAAARRHGRRHAVGRRRQRAVPPLPRAPGREPPAARRSTRIATRSSTAASGSADSSQACGANRTRGTCRSRGCGWPIPRQLLAARSPSRAAGARRAPASRDRRQSVLPHVDAARAARRARSPATRPASCRCPTRCARRCARASRTCRRKRARRSTSRRCSAGASTSRRLLAVTSEPEERAAARGRGARAAAPAARGVRRRLLRLQPRQGARGRLPRDRRRAPHDCCTAPWPRRSSSRGEGEPHERDARLAEHYERGHVWSKALHYLVLAARALAEAVRRCATRCTGSIARSRSPRRIRDALDGARAHRPVRAARRGARAGRADRRRRRRHPAS